MCSQHYRDTQGVRYTVTPYRSQTMRVWTVNEYDPNKLTNPNDVTDTYTLTSISKLSAFLADKTRE